MLSLQISHAAAPAGSQVSSGSRELQRGTGELGMRCQVSRAAALSGAAQSDDGAGLGAELLSRYGSPWKPGAPIP